MNQFKPGDQIFAGATRATFVRYVTPNQVVIAVGMDTRIVDPVSLRKAS